MQDQRNRRRIYIDPDGLSPKKLLGHDYLFEDRTTLLDDDGKKIHLQLFSDHLGFRIHPETMRKYPKLPVSLDDCVVRVYLTQFLKMPHQLDLVPVGMHHDSRDSWTVFAKRQLTKNLTPVLKLNIIDDSNEKIQAVIDRILAGEMRYYGIKKKKKKRAPRSSPSPNVLRAEAIVLAPCKRALTSYKPHIVRRLKYGLYQGYECRGRVGANGSSKESLMIRAVGPNDDSLDLFVDDLLALLLNRIVE